MAELNAGRFNRWVQKLFYIQSGGPASLHQVDSAIQPVLPYLNGAEERYLQGWSRFGVLLQAPAVAASNSSCRIRNPSGSGVVAVIEQIIGQQTTAVTRSTLQVMIANGLANLTGGTAVPLRLDFRQSAGSTIQPSFGTSNVSGQIMIAALTGGPYQFIQTENQELTMMPGDSYEVTDAVQNEAIQATFIWRERVLESSELT